MIPRSRSLCAFAMSADACPPTHPTLLKVIPVSLAPGGRWLTPDKLFRRVKVTQTEKLKHQAGLSRHMIYATRLAEPLAAKSGWQKYDFKSCQLPSTLQHISRERSDDKQLSAITLQVRSQRENHTHNLMTTLLSSLHKAGSLSRWRFGHNTLTAGAPPQHRPACFVPSSNPYPSSPRLCCRHSSFSGKSPYISYMPGLSSTLVPPSSLGHLPHLSRITRSTCSSCSKSIVSILL